MKKLSLEEKAGSYSLRGIKTSTGTKTKGTQWRTFKSDAILGHQLWAIHLQAALKHWQATFCSTASDLVFGRSWVHSPLFMSPHSAHVFDGDCRSGAKALGGIPGLKCLGRFLNSSVALETGFPTLEGSSESVRGQLLFHQISTHYFEKKRPKKQGSGILLAEYGTWEMMIQLRLYLSVVWLRK